ncbi:MAG: Gfo/Idh/MocA family oxidoreductase [Acidobacteriales bacterium]|nr:Gfo/Idh/MocA family oxidoreductase [Terriglobales bacterium]
MQKRRTFLMASAAPALAAVGANEEVTLALIGGRNQGCGVALHSIQQGAVIKTLCDLDPAVLEKTGGIIAQAQRRKPEREKDFRRVLDDKSIDAVIIATPDHWHARQTILACQAGKDVYVEKPLSQTIHEGHMMRDAARKHNRIVQVGTQRRSMEHFRSAVEYVASGKLGKICEIRTWVQQLRPNIGRPADGSPPPGVNYDAWLGPAPQRPFNPNRFHYNWRFFWDYGNAELGNQGVHILDVALWAIQKLRGRDHCLPRRISSMGGTYWLDDAKEVPDTQIVNYSYDNLLLSFELRSFLPGVGGTAYNTSFYGTEGSLVATLAGWEVYSPKGELVTSAKASGGSHERNFLECVKSRRQPNADVEIGRLSTTLCHLGNISCRLGREVYFNPRTETFGEDWTANRWLTKSYRETYTLPKV